jgi:hypothetical protein
MQIKYKLLYKPWINVQLQHTHSWYVPQSQASNLGICMFAIFHYCTLQFESFNLHGSTELNVSTNATIWNEISSRNAFCYLGFHCEQTKFIGKAAPEACNKLYCLFLVFREQKHQNNLRPSLLSYECWLNANPPIPPQKIISSRGKALWVTWE